MNQVFGQVHVVPNQKRNRHHSCQSEIVGRYLLRDVAGDTVPTIPPRLVALAYVSTLL